MPKACVKTLLLWAGIGLALFSKPLVLTEAERAFVRLHPVVTLGVGREWAPYVITEPDGSVRGYYRDLIERVNRISGMKFRLVPLPWKEAQSKAQRGEIDGLIALIRTPEREKIFRFSRPFYSIRKYIFVKNGNPSNIRSDEDLRGKTVAVHRANKLDTGLLGRFGHSRIVYAPTYRKSFEMVAFGDADAVIGNDATGYFLTRNNLPYLTLAYDLNHTARLRMAVRKDLGIAVDIFDKALETIDPAEWTKLRQKWMLISAKPLSKDFKKSEREYLYKKHRITVCVYRDFMPYSSLRQGKCRGIVCDELRYLQNDLHLELDYRGVDTEEEALGELEAKRCDLFPLYLSPEHGKKNASVLSGRTYEREAVVLLTEHNARYIVDLDEIIGKKLAVAADSPLYPFLRKAYPFLTFVPEETPEKALHKVGNKKYFAYVDLLGGASYLMQNGYYRDFKIAGRFDQKVLITFVTRKEEKLLHAVIQKGFDRIDRSTRNRIYNRWINVTIDQNVDWRSLREMMILLGTVAVVSLFWFVKLYQSRRRYRHLAMTDPMTGLYNRRHYSEISEELFAKVRREHMRVNLVLLDVDRFKKINDTYGHPVGDRVIVSLAGELKMLTQKKDRVFRVGGEEFLIVQPRSDREEAVRLAENIRTWVENHPVILEDGTALHYTVSLGVTQMLPDDSESDEALIRADCALYEAKEKGRNRVCVREKTGRRDLSRPCDG